MIQGENWQVHIGNNLDILPTLEDNSIDSIVTDPPYELGFMGKKWDSSGIAYNTDLWKECLRVLKPGGHLLSFGGTRTWHRVAVAIEDAGFEVRDSIAWMYGSGFPKSLDISKAIDKGTGENKQRQLKFTAWMLSTGITAEQINEATGTSMASHYLTEKSQPAIATADLFDKLRPYLPEVPEEIERLVAERTGIEWFAYKNREVIGKHTAPAKSIFSETKEPLSQDLNLTAPSTPEAQQWQGWGTALKPAFEPIVVARKPLIGTVAANVLEHGTGGLNIDGSRIGTSKPKAKNTAFNSWRNLEGRDDRQEPEQTYDSTQGRWPANVILDEYTAEILDEQSGASRFFYVAKASKRDRNEGLEDIEGKEIGAKGNGLARTCAICGASILNPCECPDRTFVNPTRQNFHPTVKPTALMRYLVKLVTPPNGTVLDPFTGSGSTGKAAILEGFQFIGIELTEDYIPIIEGRLNHAEKQQEPEGLF